MTASESFVLRRLSPRCVFQTHFVQGITRLFPINADTYIISFNSIHSQNATNTKLFNQRIVLFTNPTPPLQLVTSVLRPRGTDSWVKQAMPWRTPVHDASSAEPLYRVGWTESFLLFKKGSFPEGFAFIRAEIAAMNQLGRKSETVECFMSIIFPLHHTVNWDTVAMEGR